MFRQKLHTEEKNEEKLSISPVDILYCVTHTPLIT